MTKHTILFLAANPLGTDRRALDQEASSIRKELKRSGYRERFELVTRWAAEPLDLLRELRELKPAVVHFSGQGSHAGLAFQTAHGDARMVSAAAIAETFGAAGASVKLVVLSACYSDAPADALLAHVDCVVGMSGALHDDMARAFAIGFYGALGELESVAAAYRHGDAAISLEGLPEVDRPRLKIRDGFDATQLVLAATAPTARVDLPCPYPGMRPYAADDADHFHGRDTEIEDLLGRLRAREREIYVIGPSGSGKSSLVGAGILPRLARGVAGLGSFLVRSMRPGERPVARLCELLEVSHGDGALATPTDAIAALLAGRALGSSVLIVIDQLEELFTLADAGERERFLIALRALRDEPHCVVVFTMRADFFGAFMESPLWTDRRGRISRVEVGTLRGEALCEAIVRPARDLAVDVEPALIERLLAEAGSEPGVLPLLQETLVQLWDRRQGQALTLADYEALGDEQRSGLAVALSRRADAALRLFTPAQEAIARRILLRLVSFGEGRSDTRRQQPRAKLRAAEKDAADFERVLQQLIADRLLASDGADEDEDARVDLAHEVMITAWPTLGEWVRSRRDDEQHRRVLESKAAEWVQRGRGQSRLLDADETREVRSWLSDEKARDLGVSEEIQSLLTHSDAALAAQIAEAEGRRRRLRRWVTIALVVLTCAVVAVSTLAVIAGRTSREARELAEEKSREVEQQLARYYISRGRELLVNSHGTQAVPYLVAARESGVKDISLRTLFKWAAQSLPLQRFVHQGIVSMVAWSPDGRRIATASYDHTARVWNPVTGEAVTPPLEHKGEVWAVAWSPDGSRVATASLDHTARVWNAVTGQAVTPPLAHDGSVHAIAWRPDGRRVATGSLDHTARVWNAITGEVVTPPLVHHGSVDAVAWSPNGTQVVTASRDETARVWDAITGESMTPPLAHKSAVTTVVWSPNGTRIATASQGHTARAWDAVTGQPITPPLVHNGSVHAVAWSPDGTHLATASDDHTARVWDGVTGKPTTPPLVHGNVVYAVAWSPDGKRVASTSWDHTARVWDAVTGQMVMPPFTHGDEVNAVVWNPDGTRVATASLGHVARVWDTVNGQAATPPLMHGDEVNSVAWSPDGTRVATASYDHTARVWNAVSGQPVTPPLMHEDWVNAVAWSPDGSKVATASRDQTARVWDAVSGRAITPPLVHEGEVNSVTWSPDGSRVATASWDQTTRIWDAVTGRPVTRPLVHDDKVWTVAWSPNGMRVVTASLDQTARVWDPVSGQVVTPPLTHEGRVWAVAWSSDGVKVATASDDRTARVWDARTGQPVTPPLVHEGSVYAVAWSPDGTRVATASDDKTARVWDARTGQPVTPPLAHEGLVYVVAWSPDGSRLATASYDKTVRVWDAVSGQTVMLPLAHKGEVYAVTWSPDGTKVATANRDRSAQIWDTSWDAGSLADWRAVLERGDYRLNSDGLLVRVKAITPSSSLHPP